MNVHCFLKGPKGHRMLLDLSDGQPFELEEMQFNVIKHFNGRHSINELAKIFGLGEENILNFAKELKRNNLVVFDKRKALHSRNLSIDTEVRVPYLYEVHLDITSACNLKCKHCYQFPYLYGNESRKDIETEEILNLIDQMHDLNASKLVISGGEPFLRPDIVKIIKYAISKGIFISAIFTNGTVVNDKLLEFIAKEAWPSMIIAVSLDGDSPIIHDRLRGNGAFNKTIRFIKLLSSLQKKGAKYKYVINTIVTRMNQNRFFKMMSFLKGLGIEWWRIALPREQGLYVLNKEELEVNTDRFLPVYKSFISKYISDYKKDPESVISNVQVESFFKTNMLREKKLNIFKLSDPCCKYKRNAITIKPNGDVTACTGFNNLVLGNIRSTPLRNIWYSRKTQSLKALPIYKIKECAECDLYNFCGGGCRIIAFDKTRSIYRKDEVACTKFKFFKDEILPIYEKEKFKFLPSRDVII